MAIFTNFATLSYSGGTTNSNVVTGEILGTLTAAKTALTENYRIGDEVTYVVSLVNSGSTALTGLTLTDDLGGFVFDEATVYPLSYITGSVRVFVNGVLQADPAVSAGPPLVISGISVPAGGSVLVIYESTVTEFASPESEDTITNTVTVTGGGLSEPVTADETITAESGADLTITKALSPTVVPENGQITYTFVIRNFGNTAAVATDDVILTDNFDPILNPITVTYNGSAWTEGVNYTYDETTGAFATLAGQITVPAATFTQNEDGSWSVNPGTAVITVTGTV